MIHFDFIKMFNSILKCLRIENVHENSELCRLEVVLWSYYNIATTLSNKRNIYNIDTMLFFNFIKLSSG